ncbi:hypothetical protein BTVI_36350 [Pitangus sulphuratus]|nr:hypothetical protein BTVI_36350 [Pitangus sulphuratus]
MTLREKCQEACEDGPGTPGQTQTAKGSPARLEAAWEKYREMDQVRKDKPLVRDIEDNKKSSQRYVCDKRKAKESESPLQKETGDPATQDMEKAEVLNNVPPQDFTGKCCSFFINIKSQGARNPPDRVTDMNFCDVKVFRPNLNCDGSYTQVECWDKRRKSALSLIFRQATEMLQEGDFQSRIQLGPCTPMMSISQCLCLRQNPNMDQGIFCQKKLCQNIQTTQMKLFINKSVFV